MYINPFVNEDNVTEYVKYIRESHVVNLRISPLRCYLLQEKEEGESVGSEDDRRLVDPGDFDTLPQGNKFMVLWKPADGDDVHPDLRPYTQSGEGQIHVWKNDERMTRVLKTEDLIDDDEFVVVKRVDRSDKRVEIIFNAGYDPAAAPDVIEYAYTTMNKGIDHKRLKVGEDETHSLYGWQQYLNDYCDEHQGKHQILVRVPMPTRDIIIEAGGLTIQEENDCWTLWCPVVRDGDILILSPDQTVSGIEERYEINDMKYSIIQGSLVSQRFHVILLEETDLRYKIPYVIQ
jgi:hypothetical protein